MKENGAWELVKDVARVSPATIHQRTLQIRGFQGWLLRQGEH